MATLETILPWMPLVLALSTNSPYLAGELTGLASNRAEVLAQLPAQRSAAALLLVPGVGGVDAAIPGDRSASDYTQFWWDVRPHPLRDARDPHARPADGTRQDRSLRRPAA